VRGLSATLINFETNGRWGAPKRLSRGIVLG